MDNKEFIYFRESALDSILSDIFTFGIPSVLAYLNYEYLGNSAWYQFLIVIVFLLLSISRGSKKPKVFKSKKDLLEYLEMSNDQR